MSSVIVYISLLFSSTFFLFFTFYLALSNNRGTRWKVKTKSTCDSWFSCMHSLIVIMAFTVWATLLCESDRATIARTLPCWVTCNRWCCSFSFPLTLIAPTFFFSSLSSSSSSATKVHFTKKTEDAKQLEIFYASIFRLREKRRKSSAFQMWKKEERKNVEHTISIVCVCNAISVDITRPKQWSLKYQCRYMWQWIALFGTEWMQWWHKLVNRFKSLSNLLTMASSKNAMMAHRKQCARSKKTQTENGCDESGRAIL